MIIMTDLYDKINNLEKETCKSKQIEILQDILKLLLKKYIIEINGTEILPLWLEAYYYCDSFPDGNVHGAYSDYAKNMQTNRFGQLYVHNNDWGIDVCLSNGKYCLSFLVKCALINGVFCTQSVIGKNICYSFCELKDTCEHIKDCIYNKEVKIVLKKDNEKDYAIMKTIRVGLTKDPEFRNLLLSAFVFDKQYMPLYRWATGYGKQWTLSINGILNNWSFDETKEKYDYNIEQTYWNLAQAQLNGKEIT